MVTTERMHRREVPQKRECSLMEENVQYNLDFDTAEYKALAQVRTSPELYAKQKDALNGKTTFNLETMLGERFNAGLSRRVDIIENDQICDIFTKEPLLPMFIKGRDHRAPMSSEHDRRREQAEVDGFTKIQETLLAPDTPVGTMMLSISPPGGENSDYKHNFYDIFTLQENEKGERYVDSRRYSSGLNRSEYIAAAATFKKGYFAEKETVDDPYDVYFLTRPIKISQEETGITSPDELHKMLHKAHLSMSKEDYEYMIEECRPLLRRYTYTLEADPDNLELRNMIYDAILNKADEVVLGDIKKWRTIYERTPHIATLTEVRSYGTQPVREVMTGCGKSGSAQNMMGGEVASQNSPFSVSEFGKTEWFTCPKCPFKADGPIGDGPCPGCGLTKDAFAEESGIVCD